MDEARVLHSILVLLLDISAHFTLHHLISYLPHRRAVWPNRVRYDRTTTAFTARTVTVHVCQDSRRRP